MSFVQVIEFDTKQEADVQRLMDEWRDSVGEQTTVTHTTLARDHNRPGHYVTIVEFPSYDEAMRNSRMPQTEEMFHRMQSLCEGSPRFIDLDVIRDEDL
jgi:quinol monooxygenase YgiN